MRLSKSIATAIEKNDLDIAITRDLREPFREETRKAKRNLIAASFAAIIIATLDVQVNNFAGLSSAQGALAADITRGLAGLAVIYFLIGYAVDGILDYMAWRVELKRLQVTPYLLLVRSLENATWATHQQLKSATWAFSHLSSFGKEWSTSRINQKNYDDAIGQLKSIDEQQHELFEEARPLTAAWASTLRSLAFNLHGRRAIRAGRMWIWDLLLPSAVGTLAIVRCWDGLKVAISTLLG